MSRFIEAVEANLTGERTVPFWPLEPMSVSRSVQEVPFTTLLQYDIGLQWKVRVSCEPKDLTLTMQNVIKQLQVAVYGEFRDRILRLERAILEHDADKARTEIRDLLTEVGA